MTRIFARLSLRGGLPGMQDDSHLRVRTAHSGAQFESGEVYRRRGLNEQQPNGVHVEVVNARLDEDAWTPGHDNKRQTDGRTKRLRPTLPSKTVNYKGKDLVVFKSEKATEDSRWIFVTEIKDNGTRVYLCFRCGHSFTGNEDKVIAHVLRHGKICTPCTKQPSDDARIVLERVYQEKQKKKEAGGRLSTASPSNQLATGRTPSAASMLGGGLGMIEAADAALASWCAAHDVSWAAVDSRNMLWVNVVEKMRAAGPFFKPAPRETLSSDQPPANGARAGGLYLSLSQMAGKKNKVLESCAEEGGTLVSDGAKLKSHKRGMLNSVLVTRLGEQCRTAQTSRRYLPRCLTSLLASSPHRPTASSPHRLVHDIWFLQVWSSCSRRTRQARRKMRSSFAMITSRP